MDGADLEGDRERLTPGYTAYFKIAEGCSNTCAYCIIPKLRGKAYFGSMDGADLEGDRERLTPGYTAYFKIAEGCSNTCAYCIIPKLRGKYRSRATASA